MYTLEARGRHTHLNFDPALPTTFRLSVFRVATSDRPSGANRMTCGQGIVRKIGLLGLNSSCSWHECDCEASAAFSED